MRQQELCVGAALAVVVTVTSVFVSRLPIWHDFAQHLNAESFNVARALLDGRGFSDPFGEPSGPTAWVTPLYPLLLAGLLALLKTKGAAATAVIVLTNLTLIATGMTLHAICRRTRTRLPPILAVLAFVVWFVTYWDWYFAMTTDVWLCTLVLLPLLLEIIAYLRDGRVRVWRWGLLGGLAAFTSPSLACAWLGSGVVGFARGRRHAARWLGAAAVAAAIAAPWTARNLYQFGRFIPLKSNLGFEAYLANVADDDGVYDPRTMNLHPYNDERLRFEFSKLGETEYIARQQARFVQSIRAHPDAFLRRVQHRALALTLWYSATLESPQFAWLKRAVFALPVPIVLAALAYRRHRHRRLLTVLGLFWALYVAPYLLVAFYSRYIMPLGPLLVLSLFLGLDGFASPRARPTRQARDDTPASQTL